MQMAQLTMAQWKQCADMLISQCANENAKYKLLNLTMAQWKQCANMLISQCAK